jgi:hypothetical protein
LKYSIKKICWLAPDFNAHTSKRVEGIGFSVSVPVEILRDPADIARHAHPEHALIINLGALPETLEPPSGWAYVVFVTQGAPMPSLSGNILSIDAGQDISTCYPRVANEILEIFSAEMTAPSWHALSFSASDHLENLHQPLQQWCKEHKIAAYAPVTKLLKFLKIACGQSAKGHQASLTLSHDGNILRGDLRMPHRALSEEALASLKTATQYISSISVITRGDMVTIRCKANLWKSDERTIVCQFTAHDDADEQKKSRRAS